MYERKQQCQHSFYDSMNPSENLEKKKKNNQKGLSINAPAVQQHLKRCSATGQSREERESREQRESQEERQYQEPRG